MEMTRPLCESCSRKPQGIEGHESLVRDAAQSLYICGHCRAHWSRNYVGDGLFTWELFSHPASIDPPRGTQS
jgi:hypothetical protein